MLKHDIEIPESLSRCATQPRNRVTSALLVRAYEIHHIPTLDTSPDERDLKKAPNNAYAIVILLLAGIKKLLHNDDARQARLARHPGKQTPATSDSGLGFFSTAGPALLELTVAPRTIVVARRPSMAVLTLIELWILSTMHSLPKLRSIGLLDNSFSLVKTLRAAKPNHTDLKYSDAALSPSTELARGYRRYDTEKQATLDLTISARPLENEQSTRRIEKLCLVALAEKIRRFEDLLVLGNIVISAVKLHGLLMRYVCVAKECVPIKISKSIFARDKRTRLMQRFRKTTRSDRTIRKTWPDAKWARTAVWI